MLRIFLSSCLLIIAIFISGCKYTDNPLIPADVITEIDLNLVPAKLDNEISLKIDQIAFIESEGIKIKFLKVTEDSRCPQDVACIWAGQAGVMANVSINNNDMGDLIMIKGAGNSDKEIKKIGNYSVKLIKVEPYPKSTQKIEPSDYVITLIVTKSA